MKTPASYIGKCPVIRDRLLFDLEKVIALAHKYGIPIIVDSSAVTPALMRPIAMGADIGVQSVSKTIMTIGFGIAGAAISRKNLPLIWITLS